MSSAAPGRSRCPLCGKSVEPADARVGIPDLLIEMHEACYRLHVDKGAPPDTDAGAAH